MQKFPWSIAIREQAKTAKVIKECPHCRLVVLSIDREFCPKVEVVCSVPISVHTKDFDEMFVEVFIYVLGGYLDALEIWRGDGGA